MLIILSNKSKLPKSLTVRVHLEIELNNKEK